MQPIDLSVNPLTWWKLNSDTFPLLSKYYKANAGFQATSLASERIYNVDKLVSVAFLLVKKFDNFTSQIYDDRRKSIDVERGSGLVVAEDYLKRRMNTAEFELCSECPRFQSQSKYKVSCAKHNKV